MSNILESSGLIVDFNRPTFKMVGGLSIDDIKIKYLWFLNAEVEDAIIGEDENGLVWFSGEWICGTWEQGTWYSGTWHNGRWKGGNMYSYDLDKSETLKGKLSIIRIDINKTHFLAGTFEGGDFNYGIFGTTQTDITIPYEIDLDFIIEHNVDYKFNNEIYYQQVYKLDEDEEDYSYVDEDITSPVFQGGNFNDGWMNASYFNSGNFNSGFINNSIWYDGFFYGGIFLGDIWKKGSFFSGDFSNGIWENGLLSAYVGSSTPRFGTDYKGTGATWENGRFINGEFHSGLNLVNDKSAPSIDNDNVHWENGTFINGDWLGGTWENGLWKNGTFYNGIIEKITWENGYIKNCLWLDGTFNNGTISGGIFNNIIIVNGDLGNEF